jgi:uncharacterized membrane protein
MYQIFELLAHTFLLFMELCYTKIKPNILKALLLVLLGIVCLLTTAYILMPTFQNIWIELSIVFTAFVFFFFVIVWVVQIIASKIDKKTHNQMCK